MSENENITVKEAPKPGTKPFLEAELAKVQAELEAMKAEREAELAKDGTEPEAPAVPADERVDLFVDKGYANDEPNLIIGINGVTYVLPRGKTSKVPKFVADEYIRSKKAEQALDETVSKMLAEASK